MVLYISLNYEKNVNAPGKDDNENMAIIAWSLNNEDIKR